MQRAALSLVLVLVLAFVIAGCARPGAELVAFPQDTPSSDPPSNTDAPNGDGSSAPSVLRTRFPTRATLAQINRTSCSLQPILVVGGLQKKVDMRIGGVTPCFEVPPESLRVNVLAVSGDHGGREVVLELPVPTGSSQQDTNDLKLGLREVRAELERRIASLPPDTGNSAGSSSSDQPPGDKPTKHRRSSRVLAVSLSLLISGGAVGAVAALMGVGAVAARNGSGDLGWAVAGISTAIFGAAPAVLGGIVTIIIAGGMYAADD